MTEKEQNSIQSQTAATFGLLRHGRTVWNEERRIQGSMDSPLSELGKKQIHRAVPTLTEFNWTRILASDLGRVQQTVSLLSSSLAVPVVYESRLREIHWGQWEGLRFEDIEKKYGHELTKQIHAGWLFRAPGGESRKAALGRAQAALYDASERWPGETILTVCHQGIIKCLIFDILQSSFLPGENREIKKDALQLIHIDNSAMLCKQLNIQLSEQS